MRRLAVVGPADVLPALRAALSGGDAIHPVPDPGDPGEGLPDEVEQRIALVVGTSGSSGRPKRVALSTDALLTSATAAQSALGGAGQWLLALPTTYIAGINVLTRSITAGTDPVAVEGRFSPGSFLDAAGLLDAPLRFTSLVPAQLARLLHGENPDLLAALRRFDRILVGGQATPEPLVAAALELGLNLTRTYGSSETGGGCVYDGLPIGDTRMRIRDGGIELGGRVLAEGYLGDPGRTAERFSEEDGVRWYATGDAGSIVDGALRVDGRLDDVIVSGGLKVSLGDVEARIRALPGQHDAVVTGVEHAEWGAAPAVVTTVALDLAEARRATESLGPQARPVRVLVVDELPTLTSGKPDRLALQRLLAGTP